MFLRRRSELGSDDFAKTGLPRQLETRAPTGGRRSERESNLVLLSTALPRPTNQIGRVPPGTILAKRTERGCGKISLR